MVYFVPIVGKCVTFPVINSFFCSNVLLSTLTTFWFSQLLEIVLVFSLFTIIPRIALIYKSLGG